MNWFHKPRVDNLSLKETILFGFYIVYRWYEYTGAIFTKRTGKIPQEAYPATLLAYLLFFAFNISAFTMFLNLPDFLFSRDESMLVGCLKVGGLYFLPGYLLLSRIIKKEDLENLSYEAKTMRRGYVIVILYASLSLVFLIVAGLLNRNN